MADFLFKTEPSTYSFADLEAQGKAVWDGVANPVALRNMRDIKKGDRVFVYHTGAQKAVVGVAMASSLAYPDPKQPKTSLVVIDVVPREGLARPVPLATIKASAEFALSPLVRQGRLSVVPLSKGQADFILKEGGLR